ncbi:uncharacterized protein LOC128394830 [Panonychus citri]|uniref:uncharacterized protein LOC128394830 n=1 Tax=Panonychus citri TaxID=50023 RepID=UPI0023079446|nr:uncharacterized protein LOC128394830 [Panonychus citri]XP_053211175.1 uncharacterized protein LOC128394830 [Panonychus citri]
MVNESVTELKQSITRRARKVESIGKKAQKELKSQGKLLNSTNANLNETGLTLNQIEMDLIAIEQYESNLWSRIFCCYCCVNANRSVINHEDRSVSSQQIVETFTVEDRLTPHEVDKLWCQTYDPNERWYQQMESHVDRLIELIESLDHDIGQQKGQAISLKGKVKSFDIKLKNNRKTMKRMSKNK